MTDPAIIPTPSARAQAAEPLDAAFSMPNVLDFVRAQTILRIAVEEAAENQVDARAILEAAAERIVILLSQPTLANKLPSLTLRLSADEYVLPPELIDTHNRILSELRSGRPTSTFVFGGLLIFGEPGTGKTDYPKHLAYCVQDSAVDFHQLNASAVRGSQNPAEFLEKILRALNQEASIQARMKVLVLDEFDALITAESGQFVETRHESSATHTKSRSQQTSSVTETTKMDIDAKGMMVLNTLKSLVGSGQLENVLIIGTSNLTHFPPAVTRDGRLEGIELKPFGLPKTEFPKHSGVRCDTGYLPNYYFYPSRICRLLDIMLATARRLHESCPSLACLRDELRNSLSPMPQVFPGFEDKYPSRKVFGKANEVYLARILGALDLNYAGLVKEKIRFSGSSDGGDEYAQVWSSSKDKRFPEERLMDELTPSKVAAFYKRNRERLSPENVKYALALLLFPQLRGRERADVFDWSSVYVQIDTRD